MNHLSIISGDRREERGQTILLVAISLVSLLAMAALAIDVVTLYAARSEAQRAADAAALVGAKAFVDSGVTTDPANTTLQTLAQDMATAGINSVLQQNTIAGVAPALVAAPTFNFANQGNPQISVTLQRTNLPIFFARIWGKRPVSISATATAEAYNPSSSQTSTGSYVPIQPKCVKPLLVANQDPRHPGSTFVSPVSGAITLPGTYPGGVIGEPLTGASALKDACVGNPNSPCINPNPQAGQFLPAAINTPNPSNLCPSCQGSSNFEQSIECCDFNPYSCGGPTSNANADIVTTGKNVHSEARSGVQCLINQPGQDTIDVSQLIAGTGPAEITAESGPQSGNLVTTSNSIVSFPLIDTSAPVPASGQVTVVGFLQVFITGVNSVGNLQITGYILNVVGCGNSPGATPVVASRATTPIPVRLVHP